MPGQSSFEYAVIRIVPRVEREEFVNAGVILYCRAQRFLAARVQFDATRLAALAPGVDLDAARVQIDLIRKIAAGDPGTGEIAALTQPERFRWLASPRSTMVQMSPVHGGLCEEPQAALDELFERLVS